MKHLHLHRGIFSVYTEIPVLFVTGLYASGKTTFTRTFAELGQGVSFLCDDVWKQWFYVEARRSELCSFFGQNVLLENGAPNLSLLRKIFFENSDSAEIRQKVQDVYGAPFMFHLLQTVLKYLIEHKETGLVVIESDRIIQNRLHHLFINSRVVAIECSAEVRLGRAKLRSTDLGRGPSQELHEMVMSAQCSDDYLLELAAAVNAVSVININISKNEIPKIAKQVLKDLGILTQ